jgi:diguanylate cyclase (GGDEF)-like protein
MAEAVGGFAAAAALVGAGAGLAAGWWLARRGGSSARAAASAFSTDLLPEPALDWLRRSHAALGAWASEPGDGSAQVRLLRAVDARLDGDELLFLERRIARAREHEQNGAERLDSGLLLYRAAGGTATALFLPNGAQDGARRAAEQDLVLLLDTLRQREVAMGLGVSNSGTQAAVLESVESVGRRLALQLGRLTGGSALVAAREPRQVRIVGVSRNADGRLEGRLVAPEAPLAHVALGVREGHMPDVDPLGDGEVGDRRQPRVRPYLLPISSGLTVLGAAAIWPPGPDGLAPAVLAEVRQALAHAAPRLGRAAEAHNLRVEAFHDTLTGLLNRRGLELEMGKVGVTAGALIACDFDNFKKLNDTLGHPAGDAALVHFARIMREQIRDEDRAARVGGEEFSIWLPNASLALGIRVAERIRVKLGTTAWEWQGRPWPLRASFGVSACPETSRRVENLAAQSDAALYVAKRSGRNRVEAAGATVEP